MTRAGFFWHYRGPQARAMTPVILLVVAALAAAVALAFSGWRARARGSAPVAPVVRPSAAVPPRPPGPPARSLPRPPPLAESAPVLFASEPPFAHRGRLQLDPRFGEQVQG